MQLIDFTYIFLVLCIPFLGFIVNSTNPKKGFSILFISIISITGFLLPTNFTFLGILFLIIYLNSFDWNKKNIMLVVEVKNDNVEKAIRKLRKKVIQTKQLKNLKERKEYTKKSVKRRNEIQKASYIQKKYGDDY